ncbi:acyl-CoA dehydrogenase [Membranicola marinus]|uniref:Cyclohex-1-ene-1-carbonyl-CoA dehydrogenase n=1 Tax=Membranihabitans marinus TaxID=1227546 RepID=A0A953HLF6_9BACT|nr:acyl-CoA dehydrogenase [Membranihabitans marinus]MBY5958104.1 acyl-CoA dehydrogenase [Membranihabitans marinus]
MIDFSEEQRMIRKVAREFAEKELLPGVIERDKHARYPKTEINKMHDMGFMGMTVDPAYGGGGMDTLSYVIAMEEISKVDASCAVAMSVNNSLVCWGLQKYGTDEQKEKFLRPLASGKKLGAFCLSEPEAGSDASHQHTIAEEKEDHYLLSGTKNWITNGKNADIYLIMAQTHPEKGSHGINVFIVEADTDGLTTGEKEDKMGIRASDTCSVMLDQVVVPKENRIGEDGFGFAFAMKTLEGGRIGIAAQALGIASGAYERALKYAQEREAFGVPIYKHQDVSFKLADMATELEASRLLVYHAAMDKDAGRSYTVSGSMAKLYAAEAAMKITTEAVQIHGGYGYVREYHVERMMRDAKITQIYEGTSEIQKIVISRSILK